MLIRGEDDVIEHSTERLRIKEKLLKKREEGFGLTDKNKNNIG